MKRSPPVLWLALVSLACASLITPATAAARSLVIQRFDATIQINSDGTVDVVERMQPRFEGAWNGIYRTIPVEYRTPQGFNYTLLVDRVDITDDQGHALKFESSRQRHYRKLKIWVPGAVDATRTVILRYRVRNGLKFFDEHDELYWNVTGDEWEVPIETASAQVNLPGGASGVRAVAFTGGYGSHEEAAQVDVSSAEISVRTTRMLNFKEGLTVVVGWDPGLVARPSAAEKASLFMRSNLPLLVPAFVLVGMWWLWRARGRDPRLQPIAPQYEPPATLTPAEVGTLVDNSPDLRDVTATLVDLAVRGYVLIEETEEDRLFGLRSSKDYLFTLQKPWGEWEGLQPHERKLLSALFRRQTRDREALLPGEPAEIDYVRLSDLQNHFYKQLPDIREALYRKLIERGYYVSRPDRVRAAYLVGGVLLGIAVGFGTAVLSGAMGIAPFTFTVIVAAVLSAVIVCGFGWFMPARTTAGARVLANALGFEEFLRRVESDRFERVIKTPDMFEKYLPYAMALGVEKNWAKAFEDIYTKPPDWYRGGTIQSFQTRSFVSSLGSMSTQAASVMASAPRSSGGSGFGGGSSGGGFGGGGGGGF